MARLRGWGEEVQPARYALWNGFLQMVNVLELVNSASDALSATVRVYSINGDRTAELTVAMNGHEQRDIVLNSLSGFSADSYGIVTVEPVSENLDGRISQYRPKPGTADVEYEFAFAVPLLQPLTGETAVSFNTFQPSYNPSEAGDVVRQWLSIVNLDRSNTRSFDVRRYDQNGSLVAEQQADVLPFQRLDLEAGHDNPGPGNVGLNVIEPTDSSAPYLAHLVRYGERGSGGSQGYAFAFPLLASAGTDSEQWAPISNGADASNWFEVVNYGSSSADVAIDFYDNAGRNVFQTSTTLAAHAQQHLCASNHLGAGMSGAARISASAPDARIAAQSMFYFRNNLGSVMAMYGSQSRSPGGDSAYGSYNLFLGMYNWLRIFNPDSSAQTVTVGVLRPGGATVEVPLAGLSGVDLGLHDTSTFGTSPDSYGVVEVHGSAIVDLLRLRVPNNSIDFAMPTAVR